MYVMMLWKTKLFTFFNLEVIVKKNENFTLKGVINTIYFFLSKYNLESFSWNIVFKIFQRKIGIVLRNIQFELGPCLHQFKTLNAADVAMTVLTVWICTESWVN